MQQTTDDFEVYWYGLLLSTVYPFMYNIVKLWRQGPRNFFSETINIAFSVFTILSIVNFFLQYSLGKFHPGCRALMCILVVMDMLFIFWFLRIFSSLTKIVVLLAQVFKDLGRFFMFIVLMLVFFSQVPSIIGMGNVRIPGPFQDNFKEYVHLSDETCPSEFMPGYMYTNIGLFVGNFFDMARLALGDFYMIE